MGADGEQSGFRDEAEIFSTRALPGFDPQRSFSVTSATIDVVKSLWYLLTDLDEFAYVRRVGHLPPSGAYAVNDNLRRSMTAKLSKSVAFRISLTRELGV